MPQSQADYSRQREVFPACDEGAGRLLRAWRGKIPPHSLFYKRRSSAPIRLPPRNPDAPDQAADQGAPLQFHTDRQGRRALAALARQEGVSRSFRSRSRCGPCARRPKQNSPPQHAPKRRGSQAAISCDPVHKGGATKKRERQSYSTLTLKVCVRCVRRPRRGPHSRSPATGIFYLNAITIPSEEADCGKRRHGWLG